MSPTVEQPQARWYHFRLKGGDIVAVRASVLCRPDDTAQKYRLKRDGELVGEFATDEISAWWVSEEPTPIRS